MSLELKRWFDLVQLPVHKPVPFKYLLYFLISELPSPSSSLNSRVWKKNMCFCTVSKFRVFTVFGGSEGAGLSSKKGTTFSFSHLAPVDVRCFFVFPNPRSMTLGVSKYIFHPLPVKNGSRHRWIHIIGIGWGQMANHACQGDKEHIRKAWKKQVFHSFFHNFSPSSHA